MDFGDELKRRNVFRVAAAYLVVGWLLTEVLTTVLPELGAPPWAPRAIILIFALGFIPAVVLSWVYEITPSGVRREAALADGETPRGGNRRFDYFVIFTVFLLIVALAVLGARTTVNAPQRLLSQVSNASVAVLPFANMSNDEDNEYFSDGLTETLLHMLAQNPGLQVAARTSSFAFKGQNKPIREIADELNVAHVLEGSVQQQGGQVRIFAQLIRAEDGYHVWSEQFDRTYDDIFAIQDEIAEKVGTALSASLLGTDNVAVGGRLTTDDTDAYNLYLQALELRGAYSYAGLQAAENLLKGALAVDPGFLEAKTELSMNYLRQWETGLKTQQDTVQEISALAEQVLAERPDDARARALSVLTGVIGGDHSSPPEVIFAAVESLERLVAENPKDYGIGVMLTRLLNAMQRYDESLAVHTAALELDKLNPRIHYELGVLYTTLERPDDARAAIERSLEIEPEQPVAYYQLAELGRDAGDGVEVVRRLLEALTVDPRDHELPGAIAQFLYQLELFEEGDEFRKMVLALAPTSEMAYRLELLRARATGDIPAAVASARRSIEDDIENRKVSHTLAVQYLMRQAIEAGTVNETAAFIEAQMPGVFDVEASSVTAKYRMAQIASLEAWYATLPRDEFLRRLDALLQSAADFGLDPLTNDETRFAVQAYRGQVDDAIETGLRDVFTQTVLSDLDWRAEYAQAQYRDIVSDPRIQAALARWSAEYATVRESVRAYLADLSASN